MALTDKARGGGENHHTSTDKKDSRVKRKEVKREGRKESKVARLQIK